MNLWKAVSVCCLAMLAATSTSAWAETWHTSKIKNVYPLSNGSFVLIFSVDATACAGSSPGKYHYIAPGENGVADGVKMMIATALMALAMEKAVSVALFDETSSGCYVNRLISRD